MQIILNNLCLVLFSLNRNFDISSKSYQTGRLQSHIEGKKRIYFFYLFLTTRFAPKGFDWQPENDIFIEPTNPTQVIF